MGLFGGPAPVGRGVEADAALEVRVRMPARHLGGTVTPGKMGRWGDHLQLEAPAYATLPPATLLVPTVCNPTGFRLRSVIERGREQGHRVVLDSEANVWAHDAKQFVTVGWHGDTLGPKPASQGQREQWLALYSDMVRSADAVTVATAPLVEVYRDAGARDVFLVPNAIDPEQWPEPAGNRWDDFAVGYAGTPSGRHHDIELIRPALEWAHRQAGVESVLFGTTAVAHIPFGGITVPQTIDSLPSEWKLPSRRIHFKLSYAEYRQTLMRLLDVGLMPLADTSYNRGRSDLKICEYAMAGALPIVQDCDNYAAWRDSPVLFARDADEFLAHVQWAVDNRDEVRERATAVREIVLRTRTIAQTIDLWRAAVAGRQTPGVLHSTMGGALGLRTPSLTSTT